MRGMFQITRLPSEKPAASSSRLGLQARHQLTPCSSGKASRSFLWCMSQTVIAPRRRRRQHGVVGAQLGPTDDPVLPRRAEVLRIRGVDLSPREQVPDRGDTILTDKSQVGAIPIECQILDGAIRCHPRERIRPGVAHVPEMEPQAVGPGEKIAIVAETKSADYPSRPPGDLLERRPGVRRRRRRLRQASRGRLHPDHKRQKNGRQG